MSIVVPIDNTLPNRLNQIAGFIKLAMVHVGVVAKRSNIKGKRIRMMDVMNARVLWGVGTARTVRVHWALAELGLQYRCVPIQARTPAMEEDVFRKVSPFGKIPVLEDGALVLSESPAIVTYLAERYSSFDNRLIPDSVLDRARYFEWLSFISMELDATSIYVLRRHVGLPEIYGDAPNASAGARDYFARMIGAAVTRLSREGPYLLGQQFSGVDILMTSCLDIAETYDLRVPEPFKHYRERVAQRPAYAVAIAANQPQ